jgi:hypothetical protein
MPFAIIIFRPQNVPIKKYEYANMQICKCNAKPRCYTSPNNKPKSPKELREERDEKRRKY